MNAIPPDTAAQIRAAWALCANRRFDEALGILHDAVRRSPQAFEGWLLLAQLELRQERYEVAAAAAITATALQPANSDALYVLGRVHKARGDLASALQCYRRAIEANPGNADLLTSAGIALRALGDIDAAVAMYRRALEINPQHAEANNNLGNAIAGRGATDEARVLHVRGRSVLAGEFQAVAERIGRLRSAGKLDEAFECCRDLMRLAPHDAGTWLLGADLALQMGYDYMSLPYYEKAAQLDASCLSAVEAARRICIAKGLRERAERYSRLAQDLHPSDTTLLALKLFIPSIQQSNASIIETRAEYARNIDEMLAADLRIGLPDGILGTSAFYLAYHGSNDRELQIKAARLYLQAMPSLAMTAQHCGAAARRPGRIRLGFISRFLHDHSIGKTTRGLVEQISRERFEVFVLRITPTRDDDTARAIAAAADHTVRLSQDFLRARDEIAALELDVLFYQDIGMEPMSYFLAFARLAPVQCVSFGHPNTTGIPTMDYFVSNDLFETPDAPLHYSEQLFLLHDLPTLAYYHPPRRGAERLERASFGLPQNATLYLCPQTLYKLHPALDALLRDILVRDQHGLVVLIAALFGEFTEQLRARFERSMPEVAARVRFVPPQPQQQFLELLSNADVVLDTLHFNGMNSSLESFAVGTPVVTLPTAFQRGRHTQAMYRKMGIFDCIASDASEYVSLAVRLGTDRAFARSVRERILASNRVLFEDPDVVREFERFFLTAHEARCAAGCGNS